MTKLDTRDRRRAMKVIDAMNAEPNLNVVKVRDLISAALKRERDDCNMAKFWLTLSKGLIQKDLKALAAKRKARETSPPDRRPSP